MATVSTGVSASGYISMGGFYSNLDTASIISALDAVNRAQTSNLSSDISSLDDQNSAYGYVLTSLSNLQTAVAKLNDPDLYRARKATLSNTSVGTATASTSALAGSAQIEVLQLATASTLKSGGKASDAPTGSSLATSAFGSDAVGTFSVNNTQLTITDTTTINDIVTSLNSISGITASYDSSTGKFSLTSTGNLVLGTSGDTSLFLQDAQLFNSNVTTSGSTKTVASSLGAGRLDTSSTLGSISNWGGISGSLSGSGSITINGVSISYSTSDTLATLISNINNSSAGVTATYDSYSDEFVLTSKNRGSYNITVSDGELAQALRIRTSTDTSATVGKATQFRVNGGNIRESNNNTITESELGVTGLSFTATSVGSTNVTITGDAEAVQKVINSFVEQYNSTQNLIQSYIKIDTTDSATSTTASSNNGVLASDGALTFIQSDLRNAINGVFNSSGAIRMLEDLGVKGNENDNTLTTADLTSIQDALDNNLDQVVNLFTAQGATAATGGLYQKLNTIIDSYNNSATGIIKSRQQSISDQKDRINDEIDRINTQADAEKAHLEESFAALEAYSAKAQQVSSYLDQLKSSSSSN